MTSFKQKNWAGAVLCALLAWHSAASWAAPKSSSEPATGQSQLEKSAQEAARKHANRTKQGKQAEQPAEQSAEENSLDNDTIRGPATIPLGAEGSLKLPAGMVFIKKDAANALMVEMGNRSNPNRYG